MGYYLSQDIFLCVAVTLWLSIVFTAFLSAILSSAATLDNRGSRLTVERVLLPASNGCETQVGIA
jgi:hypothetical protein